MGKKRIIILGAGLAGLSAAYHLQKNGNDCCLLEKEGSVGGLCRSKNKAGFVFDCAGHLLHFRHNYTFKLAQSLLKDNLIKHKRSAWVYSFGRYTPYPFQSNLFRLPKGIAEECLLDFIKTNSNGKKDKPGVNFKSWIYNTFGRGIARYFMIPYNTKFWTLPPERLTTEWIDGFIPVPSLDQVIEGSLGESRQLLGYNSHFWYPAKGGVNELVLALASRIKNIRTNCQVTGIDPVKKEVRFGPGDKERFDYLISTLPLPELPAIIHSLPSQVRSSAKKLKWNSIFNLNLGLKGKDDSGRHWVYFPGKETSFYRLGFFHNFSSCLAPLERSSLYIEAAYCHTRPPDKNRLALNIKKELDQLNIFKADEICAEDTNDIKYGYPVYDPDYHDSRKVILDYLFKNNILSCGRYGSWRYFSMEDTILDARDAANYLLKK